MSAISAYKKVTLPTPSEKPEQEEDAASFNARIAWLASDHTQRVFAELLKESDSCVADAIGLALVNHQQDNNKQIVHKLIEANILRKVVKKYAAAQ